MTECFDARSMLSMAKNNKDNSCEKPKRLKPKGKALRALYLKSGNLCAFENCKNVMINNQGVMIGEICHIEAALPDGKRFNPSMTNESRRAEKNLVLLCIAHHKIIDSSETNYSVKQIKKMKKCHEKLFTEIGKTLSRRFIEQINDETDKLVLTLPVSLKLFEKTRAEPFEVGEIQDAINEIENYSELMKKIPAKHRNFMLALFKRSQKMGFTSHGGVSVNVDDLTDSLNISQPSLRKYSDALERYGVGGAYEVEENVWEIGLNDPSENHIYWCEIGEFCETNNISIDEFFIDLNFQLLD